MEKTVKTTQKMTANGKLAIAITVTIICLFSAVVCILFSNTPIAFLGCFVAMFGGCCAAFSDWDKTRKEEQGLAD